MNFLNKHFNKQLLVISGSIEPNYWTTQNLFGCAQVAVYDIKK